MRQAQVTKEKSVLDKSFNIEDYLKKTWYAYAGPEVKIKVRFHIEALPVVTQRNMKVGNLIEINEAEFVYEFIANGVDGIKLWLLGFGDKAEVLKPQELREKMKDVTGKMRKIYY